MTEEITSQLNPRARKVRYLIAAVFLLAIAVCWGFWSEGSSLRTRNKYRAEFARRFNAYLDRVEVRSADAQKKINDDPQYQKLYQRYTQLSEQAEGQAKEIRPKLDQVNKELAPVIKIFREFQNPSGQPINYAEMEKKYISLKQQKDGLTAQLDALMKPSKKLWMQSMHSLPPGRQSCRRINWTSSRDGMRMGTPHRVRSNSACPQQKTETSAKHATSEYR